MSRVVITGASGGPANRLEINEFIKDPVQFSLYIQALLRIYTAPDDEATSFFQLAGIHGLPYAPWNGATTNAPPNPTDQWGGYCVHGSVLFPTWHRPYLMLFEQVLQAQAKSIASEYRDQPQLWRAAAEALRQPYWDWASKIVPPDEVIARQSVRIRVAPDAKWAEVPNPFYEYRFSKRPFMFPAPYDGWDITTRHPLRGSGQRDGLPVQNVNKLRSQLRASQDSIKTNTYNMLTRVRTWTAFSNHTVGDGGSGTNSIEAIHDQLHVLIGGGGHMSDPGVADRLLSLWTGIHGPSDWVEPGDAENGSWMLEAEQKVGVDTPLTPFWNSNAKLTFWTSRDIRDTANLGYTYPEFNNLDMQNENAVQSRVVDAVNRLYGGEGAAGGRIPVPPATVRPTSSAGGFTKPFSELMNPINDALGSPMHGGGNPGAAPNQAPTFPVPEPHGRVDNTVDHGRNSGLWDWTARITFEKYELKSSFSVLLFLGPGPIPEDPDDWLTSDAFVGMHTAFVNVSGAQGKCANCRHGEERGLVEEGFVHLDEGIIRRAGLDTLDPRVVRGWLKDNLGWRAQKPNGTPSGLSSLQVSVFATALSYPPSASFPIPGERHYFEDITAGRRGGARPRQ